VAKEVAMVTYRKNLEKKGWHRPWPIRILSAVIGLILFMAGGLGWALETEYGGDPDRQEYVIGWDDELGGAVVLGGEHGEVVYEATDLSDAEAWVEAQRGSRNYTVPILLFAVSAVFVAIGVAPSPRKEGTSDSAPPLEVTG
jgi:hypothetical protein